MVAETKRLDELALARLAADGDSPSEEELRSRVLRCAISVARKMRWHDALDAGELEDDVPGEVVLRLISRIRQGFTGEPIQFRTYLYRVVVSVTADSARRNLDRRRNLSLDARFENSDGQASTLGDFIERAAGMGSEDAESDDPERSVLSGERASRLISAVQALDDWCRLLVNEAVVEKRPHADVARENGVSVVMLDVSLKRCTERLYRNLLMAYVASGGRARRADVAAVAERLPADQRAVFLPWWNEGTSVRQIAVRLGIGSDDARRTLSRSKATMWHLMQEP